VLVKLGARGSLMVTREGEVIEQTAFPPDKLVDTTGAGDAFTAGFAVGLAEGLAFRQAMELGAAAATLAIGVKGAMPSMPHRAAVEGLLKRLGRR
jgi:ribokinase